MYKGAVLADVITAAVNVILLFLKVYTLICNTLMVPSHPGFVNIH